MEFLSLLKSIKNKEYQPIYFLHGEEPYYIDQIVDCCTQSILSESEVSFNLSILYGKEITCQNILDECKQYPMMAPYRVVIVKEAQSLSNLEGLESYILNPVPTTILVIAYMHKKLDMRSSIAKIIAKKAIVFESTKIRDDKISQWISAELKSRKISFEEGVPDLLAEYLGNDLSKIYNELEKLQITLREKIKIEDIYDQIGISKEYNIFELNKCLGTANFAKAAFIINRLCENLTANAKRGLMSSLFGYFQRIIIVKQHSHLPKSELAGIIGVNPFFMDEYFKAASIYTMDRLFVILDKIKEAELSLKGMAYNISDPKLLLEDILLACIHGNQTVVYNI